MLSPQQNLRDASTWTPRTAEEEQEAMQDILEWEANVKEQMTSLVEFVTWVAGSWKSPSLLPMFANQQAELICND